MNTLISISRDGRFSAVAADDGSADVLHVSDVAAQSRLGGLLDRPAVRLRVDGFSDGRGFSVARLLRLQGFSGVIEIIGDLLPDQLPMAVASGVDAIVIRGEHAERCDESQWRRKAADKNRFGYQRLVAEV